MHIYIYNNKSKCCVCAHNLWLSVNWHLLWVNVISLCVCKNVAASELTSRFWNLCSLYNCTWLHMYRTCWPIKFLESWILNLLAIGLTWPWCNRPWRSHESSFQMFFRYIKFPVLSYILLEKLLCESLLFQ